jgi:hypothetical protein
MALDPRSLRRLEELGRRLPAPLPPPVVKAPPEQRHPVETETDPDKLFQQLMQASPDGSVPPHLLDRLRALESERRAGASANKPARPKRAQPGRQERRQSPVPDADPQYVAFEQMLLEDDELP